MSSAVKIESSDNVVVKNTEATDKISKQCISSEQDKTDRACREDSRIISVSFPLTWCNTDDNNDNHNNVNGAVIMTKVIVRVHPFHLMNAD